MSEIQHTELRPLTDGELTMYRQAHGRIPPSPLEDEHIQTDPLAGSLSMDYERAPGLGRNAVRHALTDVDRWSPTVVLQEPSSDSKPWMLTDGDITYTDRDKTIREWHIEEARGVLRGLSPDKRNSLEQTMFRDGRELPEWLREQVLSAHGPEPAENSPAPILSALIEWDDKEGTYCVGNETFLNVLEWHNWHLVKEQKNFESVRGEYMSILSEGVARLVNAGDLPSAAMDKIGQLEGVYFALDDGMDTVLEGRGGFHKTSLNDVNNSVILLGPDHLQRERVLIHEALHDMTLREEKIGPESNSGIMITFASKSSFYGSTVIMEALTEHVAGAVMGDDMHNLEVTADKHAMAYPEERQLIRLLCENGAMPVDIRLFVNALFEEVHVARDLGDNSANALLKKALSEAFPGMDIVGRIADLQDDESLTNLIVDINLNSLLRKNAPPLLGLYNAVSRIMRWVASKGEIKRGSA